MPINYNSKAKMEPEFVNCSIGGFPQISFKTETEEDEGGAYEEKEQENHQLTEPIAKNENKELVMPMSERGVEWNSRHSFPSMVPLVRRLVWPPPTEVLESMPVEVSVEQSKRLEELRKEHKGVELCKLCKKFKPTHGHLMRHLQLTRFKCDVCEKMFQYKSNLKYHFRIHTKEKPYNCNYCGKLFSHSTGLKYHVGASHETRQRRTHGCEVCGKIVSSLPSLRIHLRIHGPPKYKCHECGRGFTQRGNLTNHIRTRHGSERPFSCNKCPKSFKIKKDLSRHGVVHSADYRYKCEECDEAFKYKNLLVVHKLKHSANPQPFTCEFCGKSYSLKNTLNKHMECHTTETFPCTHCGKRFNLKTSLRAHLRTHTEKEEQCPTCGKTFKNLAYLRVHRKIHSGEKFICNECNQTYSSKNALKVHVFSANHLNPDS